MGKRRIRKVEAGILIGLLLTTVVAFLPWASGMTIAGVSLLAWILWLVMVVAMLASVATSFLGPRE